MAAGIVRALAASLITAAVVATGATSATAAPATAQAPARSAPIAAVDFTGAVALSNCSGSVVRTPSASDNDPALVLTNGHCSEYGFPGPGEVNTNLPSSRTFSLLSPDGSGSLGTLQATSIEYNSMTGTDVTLYKLSSTYADIQAAYGIPALVLAGHPAAGTSIAVVSGYWQSIWTCSIDGFAYQLLEGGWTFSDSIRYTPECDTIGGTSGSPIVDANSGQVVGVNNTRNEDGQQCTLNNPCEVDQSGNVTVHYGIGYGQETYQIPACIGPGSDIDLNLPGCALPR